MKHSINIHNEKSLHSQIKSLYSNPDDKIEFPVDNYIIDIVRDDLLIEVQTKNFSSLKVKLESLLPEYKVRIVHPIANEKWLTLIDTNNEIIRKRKSPKKGNYLDVFQELIRIPHLVNDSNFSLEVLLITEEEIRRDDGQGSWRRKGISIYDRKLITINESMHFNNKLDFLKLLTIDLTTPFSNKMLSQQMNMPLNKAQKITYCLRKMDALKVKFKKKNELFFCIND